MFIFVVNHSMTPSHCFSKILSLGLLVLCLVISTEKSFAQYKIVGHSYGGEMDSTLLPSGPTENELAARDVSVQVVTKLQLNGYAGCRFDSLIKTKDQIDVYFYIGPRLDWESIGTGNVPEDLLRELNYPKDSFVGTTFHPQTYLKLVEKMIEFYEQRGHPFVSVSLDNLKLKENKISATLFLDKGPKIVMDTLDIRGNSDLRKSFLYSYLGFKPGELYNESVVVDFDQKIRKLHFVTLVSPTKIFFLHNKAHAVLHLKKKRTDRIDGIVGLAPNSEQSDKQDLLLTGEVNINLHNLMGSAKAFDLKWKSFGARSQELKLAANMPYLFKKPFGIDGFAEIFKYDTFTINVRSGLGIQYLFQGTNYLRFYYENSLSILQSVDTAAIRVSKAIPNTNPVNIKTYGVDFLLEQVDYIFNPRRGFKLKMKVGLGSKVIEEDSKISKVLFTSPGSVPYSVYDSLDLRILTGTASYKLAYFFPVGKKTVIVPSIQGKHILSDKIFFDELYRIGGNGDLRGFDERAIQASSYHIYQLEYRYLISRNSYFSGFYNGAYYQNVSEGFNLKDTPFGFGLGLNLEVKAGILSLAYALGKEKGNPIQLNQSKIHFGIISFL
jgi:outer membrane protein assembly factor BamA